MAQDPARLQTMLQASRVAIVVTDTERRVTEWAGAAEELYGWSADEMLGELIDVVWPPDPNRSDLRAFTAVMTGEVVELRTARVRKDGQLFIAEVNARPIFDDDGDWAGTITIAQDITAAIDDAAALDRVLAESGLAVIGIDGDLNVTQWGGAATELYGWTADEIVGRPVTTIWPSTTDPDHIEALDESWAGRTGRYRAVRVRKDGSRFLAELTHSPSASDGWVGTVTISRDVSDQPSHDERCRHRRHATAFTAAALPMVICQLDGTILEANDAYGTLAGRTEPAAMQRFLDLIEPEHRPPIAAALGTLAAEPSRFEGIEVPLAGSDNHILNLSIAPVDEGPDRPPLALVQLIDVSDQLRIQAELAEIATMDPLTQVFNRSCFEPLMASFDAGQAVGLLFIDLDEFKDVNDSLGHAAGDAVLQAVAQRLDAVVRDSDYVIRFGGDEFVIACPGLADPGAAMRLGERLHNSVNKPIEADGHLVDVTVSIGVSLVEAGPDLDPEAAIGAADQAMYEAKAKGRDTTVTAPLP
ncbi:MAG: diguanylate cyclase [Actinomycetota bacterium]